MPRKAKLGDDEAVVRAVEEYCRRYGVPEGPPGALPPFPAGRRESAQHREWLALYKARARLARRPPDKS